MLDPKEDKAKITALDKDKKVLEQRIALADGLMADIGGQITAKEARNLILKKLNDLVSGQLERYINSEKRQLVSKVENLWDKYAVSSQTLEGQREKTLTELNGFLDKLGYLSV